jgi:hypothetical protein
MMRPLKMNIEISNLHNRVRKYGIPRHVQELAIKRGKGLLKRLRAFNDEDSSIWP